MGKRGDSTEGILFGNLSLQGRLARCRSAISPVFSDLIKASRPTLLKKYEWRDVAVRQSGTLEAFVLLGGIDEKADNPYH